MPFDERIQNSHCYLMPIITTTNNTKSPPSRYYSPKSRTRKENTFHRRALKDNFNFSLASEFRDVFGQFVDICDPALIKKFSMELCCKPKGP